MNGTSTGTGEAHRDSDFRSDNGIKARLRERATEEKSGKKWSLTRKKQAVRKRNRVRELRESHDLSRVAADVEIYVKIADLKKYRRIN